MKPTYYFLSIILLCVLSACDNTQKANTNSISIEIIGAVQPDSIKLLSFNNSEGFVAKEGNPYLFNFNNTIYDAYVMDAYKNGKTFSEKIFLDGQQLKIQAQIKNESIEIDTVIGSDIYYKSIDFYSRLDNFNKKQVRDSTLNEFLLQSIKENLSHPFSFDISDYYLEKNQNYKSKLRDLKTILDEQPEALKTHTLSVHRTLEDLVKNEQIELSDFQFYNRNGKVAKVDMSHNGDILLDFWFVQCPPCVKDHKKIGKHLDLFSENEVELVGISIDTESDKWLKYLEVNNYNWQNYRELRNENDLVDALNVWEFPTYILVNNRGEIKTRFYSFKEMETYFTKP